MLRVAKPDDAWLLFNWVNAPDSLVNKEKTTGSIDWNEHQSWFNRRLEDPESHIYIVESHSIAVGQVRLERKDEGTEVDIYIVPAARGRKYAQLALQEALSKVAGRPAVARVRESNQASRRLFTAIGFKLTFQEDDILVFTYSD
jgi:UDP-2,4-diacetamido-2,4,6-trideoxy-beta-L-altropyranose hydrolase